MFPIVKGLILDPCSVANGMILALGLRNQGYGCENPGRTPPSKFFGVPPHPHRHPPPPTLEISATSAKGQFDG